MAIDITAIGIGVDTSKLRQGTKDLDSFGRSANTAAGKADTSTKSMGGMAAMAGRLAVVLGAAGLAKSLISVIDANTKYTAQLKLATQTQEQFNLALSDVQRIARTAQSDIGSVATLYARLNTSLRDVGVTQAEVARITENVGLALKVSGATASESSSAILQLSQAFASGVLRGEEFNAVSESAPALMQALGKSMRVPIGQLRSMAAEGLITGEVLNKAFSDEKLLESFRKQAKEVNTVSGAYTVLKGEFTGAMAEFVKGTGIVDLVTTSINLLSSAIGGLREVTKSADIKDFFARIIPSVNFFKQSAGFVNSLRPNAPVAGAGNSIGGARAITGGGNIAPNFNAGIGVVDVDKLHKQQEIERRNIEEIESLRKTREREKQQRLDAYISTQNEFNEMTKKYLAISMEVESKIINETRDAKIKADKEVMEIRQRQANENFKNAQDIAKKETAAMDDAFKDLKNSVDGYSRDMARSLAQFAMGGKVSFANMIDSMLLKLLEFANQKLIFDPLFKSLGGAIDAGSSGGLGGLLGNIAGGIGNFFTGGVSSSAGAYSIDQNPYLNFNGGRANGGNVYAGKSYKVGERGAEMFVPSQNGSIVPNNQMGGGNTNVVVNVIEAQGTKANVQQQQNPDGTMSISVIVEQLYGVMNRDLQKGSGIAPTLERRYGLNRLAGA